MKLNNVGVGVKRKLNFMDSGGDKKSAFPCEGGGWVGFLFSGTTPKSFYSEMSQVMTKSVYAICKQQRRSSVTAFLKSDHRHLFFEA